MSPVAADGDGEIMLQDVTRLPLRLHFGVGSGLAGSKSFDAGVKGENVIVEVGAEIEEAVTPWADGTTKTGAITGAAIGHQVRHRNIGEVIGTDDRAIR